MNINVMTNTMEKTTEMLRATDKKLKAWGETPYGTRKATPKEQRQMYENLTEGQLYEMVEKHGQDAVNKWLYRMEQGGK